MFRKGGTTGGGIMNNVVERGQYAESNADDLSINTDKDIKGLSISDKINLVESLGGSDSGLGDPLTQFLLQIGPRIGTQTGKGGLIPNILEASKEPVSDLITAQRARKKTRQAIGLEFIKDLSDSDKIALQKKIDYLVNVEGLGRQEAIDRVIPEFRKDASEASIARGVKDDYIKSISAANTDYEGNVLFDDRQARLIYDDEQKLKETNPDEYNQYFRGDPSSRYIYQYDNYDPESMTVKEGSDLELLPENRVVYDISTGNFIKRQGKKVIIIDTTVVED